MRRAAKVDDNQKRIVEALESLGWLVWSTAAMGRGFPDVLACKAGRMVLLEIKNPKQMPSDRRLTPDQQFAHAEFQRAGIHVHIVERIADLQQLDREARAKFETSGTWADFPGE